MKQYYLTCFEYGWALDLAEETKPVNARLVKVSDEVAAFIKNAFEQFEKAQTMLERISEQNRPKEPEEKPKPVKKHTLQQRYEIYLFCANDGNGNDITTGEPLLTFNEWLNN